MSAYQLCGAGFALAMFVLALTGLWVLGLGFPKLALRARIALLGGGLAVAMALVMVTSGGVWPGVPALWGVLHYKFAGDGRSVTHLQLAMSMGMALWVTAVVRTVLDARRARREVAAGS